MNDELKYAIEHGMIDISYVQEQIEMNKRKELLEKHPYTIWEGKDGYWHTYLPDKVKGRIPKKKNTRESIENDVIGYWKSEMENPTIEEVFEEWNNRRLELQKISKATHLRNTQVFNRHYVEFGKRKIKSVDPEVVGEFLEEQIPKHQLSSKAFANLKSVTRGFLKRAKKRKLIDFAIDDIFNNLDTSETDFKKAIKEDYEEVFNENEMSIIVSYLESKLDIINLGILLLFFSGVRVGELVALKWEDIIKEKYVKIRRTETRFTDKNGNYVYEIKEFPKTEAGVRQVAIPDDYTWIIKKIRILNPFGEYIFLKNKKRINTSQVRRRLYYVCKKTGIYQKSPHKIRKTYGSILLDNNIDSRLVLKQMGHTNILTTENHYHRNRRSDEEISGIISNIPELMIR